MEEDKQTEKTVNETLVYHGRATLSMPLGNKTEEGSRKKRKQQGRGGIGE